VRLQRVVYSAQVTKALVFDVGDVMLLSNWEILDDLERATGRTIVGRGPYAPEGDPDWHAVLRGELGMYPYWDRKAQAAGYTDGIAMFSDFQNHIPDFFAPDALALLAEARAAGVKTGILTNDLVRISGLEWSMSQPALQGHDAFVDATVIGHRKPALEGYLKVIAELGLPPEDIVFLDDTPECVEGARAVGMIGVHIDPMNRGVGFERAREFLGLVPPSEAQRLVSLAEAAYGSQDLDAIMPLLHPQIVIYWNGQKVASGIAEAKRFHMDTLGFGSATTRHDYRLTKTLRAAQGDTICVEWESSYRRDDGMRVSSKAGEFWTMRYGLLIEWHAYNFRSEES
jgi:putative hydrolase of the HAD superfamily